MTSSMWSKVLLLVMKTISLAPLLFGSSYQLGLGMSAEGVRVGFSLIHTRSVR